MRTTNCCLILQRSITLELLIIFFWRRLLVLNEIKLLCSLYRMLVRDWDRVTLIILIWVMVRIIVLGRNGEVSRNLKVCIISRTSNLNWCKQLNRKLPPTVSIVWKERFSWMLVVMTRNMDKLSRLLKRCQSKKSWKKVGYPIR